MVYGETYEDFVAKFKPKLKPKLTTDDCYTPPAIYEIVEKFVRLEYKLGNTQFVRPFYPGGDYENFSYPDSCVVVDNPPFSIISKIVRFYMKNKIKFFLFAPGLITVARNTPGVATICTSAVIKYENGALIPTNFVTNLEAGIVLKTMPDLNSQLKLQTTKKRTQIVLPKNVITISRMRKYANERLAISEFQVYSVDNLKELMKKKKKAYGKPYLISDEVVETLEALEALREPEAIIVELSEAEKAIVEKLNRRQ